MDHFLPGPASKALYDLDAPESCLCIQLRKGGHMLLRTPSPDDVDRWLCGLTSAARVAQEAAGAQHRLAPSVSGRFEPEAAQAPYVARPLAGAAAPPLSGYEPADREHVVLQVAPPSMLVPRAAPLSQLRVTAASLGGRQGSTSSLGSGSGGGGGAVEPPQGGSTEQQLVAEAFSRARHGKGRELASLLSGGGVNPRCRDAAGNSLLHTAAQNNSRAACKAVLRATDFASTPPTSEVLNAQNAGGQTALHFAFAYGYHALGEYLLSLGADETLLNASGLCCYKGLEQGANATLPLPLQTAACAAGRARVAARRAYAEQRSQRAELSRGGGGSGGAAQYAAAYAAQQAAMAYGGMMPPPYGYPPVAQPPPWASPPPQWGYPPPPPPQQHWGNESPPPRGWGRGASPNGSSYSHHSRSSPAMLSQAWGSEASLSASGRSTPSTDYSSRPPSRALSEANLWSAASSEAGSVGDALARLAMGDDGEGSEGGGSAYSSRGGGGGGRRRGGAQEPVSAVESRAQAVAVAAQTWSLVCEEALACDALWRLLDVCHTLAGMLGGGETEGDGLLASAEALLAHRELMGVLASTLRADEADADGSSLTSVLAHLPRLVACCRAGADGSVLEVGLARLQAQAAALPVQPPSVARAAGKVHEAREVSAHFLSCLGPEGAPPEGVAQALPRAGEAMRTLHDFVNALARVR